MTRVGAIWWPSFFGPRCRPALNVGLPTKTFFGEGKTVKRNVCYTVSGKKRTNSILGITSSNTDRFKKLFHFYNLLEICNKAVVKYPIAPKTRHYTTL